MNFNSPMSSSLIELTGVTFSFETPNSKLRIKYFQSAVGNSIKNGNEFLKYMRPVRELLEMDQIKDIKQIVQRELDDVRIINSLVPYILNSNNILGDEGVSFFPSVLSVLMPKDYLSSLDGIYPGLDSTTVNEGDDIFNYGDSQFNWCIKQYKDGRGDYLPYSTLTIDKNKCDLVVIDGQHRVNAFRAASDAMTLDDDIIKEIYHSSNQYPNGINASLPVTIIWFEKIDPNDTIQISPETISRRLFIDVNNTARNIATSRKILLDDKTPSHLLTNEFYSLVAEKKGFELKDLSLAHLGFDVPVDVSLEKKNNIPFTYITTPERLKYVFENFFMRNKSYVINGTTKLNFKTRSSKYNSSATTDSKISTSEINITLPYSSNCITQYYDEYLEKSIFYVPEDRQIDVRKEFADKYFDCFYFLIENFSFYKEYLDDIHNLGVQIESTGTLIEKTTWANIFTKGKGLYYTLKSNAVDSNNKYKQTLISIEEEFIKNLQLEKYNTYLSVHIDGKSLRDFFNTIAFQIGYFQAFYQFCCEIKQLDFSIMTQTELMNCADEFMSRINLIKKVEWANLYQLTKEMNGSELHPKVFPTITHLILRRIQNKNEIFDIHQYFAPECEYFHKTCVKLIDRKIADEFGQAEIKSLNLSDLLRKQSRIYQKPFQIVFEEVIEAVFNEIPSIFNTALNCVKNYVELNKTELISEVYKDLRIKN